MSVALSVRYEKERPTHCASRVRSKLEGGCMEVKCLEMQVEYLQPDCGVMRCQKVPGLGLWTRLRTEGFTGYNIVGN